MHQQKLSIIEFPSNLGLKEPAPGVEPGVRKLPQWLRQHGFHDAIKPINTTSLTAPPYSMDLDSESGIRNADVLVKYAQQQDTLVAEVLDNGHFALAIGGDCSILLGPLLTLKKKGNCALFYLDGHTDFMWPELSETGGAGGMAAAFAAGAGHEKLTDIDGLQPYIHESHVWCVGNREYVDWYEEAIIQSTATYVPLRELREKGIGQTAAAFINMVEKQHLDGFWIHFDVDVLNDDVMPAVDSRTSDGLSYTELSEILTPLLTHPKSVGLTLTILDPDLDVSGQYTAEFVKQITPIFQSAFPTGET